LNSVGSGRARNSSITAVLLLGLAGLLVVGPGSSQASASARFQYSSPAQIRAGNTARDTAGIISGTIRAPGGPYLYDRFGRVVLLHGVNAVEKRAPYELYPDPGKPWNFTAADARRIAHLGFDVVRLGILWQGIETGNGGLNDTGTCADGRPGRASMFNAATVATYLDRITRTVDLLGRFHVYTLLDMHQDVYNQAFRGEGAPTWAVCTDNQPIVPLGGRWSHNYRSPTLHIAETHFWLNNVVGNLQGQFDQAWSKVAHHFANNPWIVGYDPYNEPFSPELSTVGAQTFAKDLECFYTGRAHPGTYGPTDGRISCPPDDPSKGVVPTIEAADPHHLVFIEPDNFSVRHQLPSLLGSMDFPNLVYNFHSYCGFRSPVNGDPTKLNACSDQIFRNILMRHHERPGMASKKQPGGPAWFMSEFGATQSVPLLDDVTDFAGDVGLGWIYWSWKYYDDPTGSSHEALVAADGKLKPTAKVLAQPFAQAIAGTPVSTDFDTDNAIYHLTYAPSHHIAAPTVLFPSGAFEYPHGYCASVAGGHIVSPPGQTHLLVDADAGSTRVSVIIHGGGC
jgi:endoglycosylceramidase